MTERSPARTPPGDASQPLALAWDSFDHDALALAEQSAGVGVWSIDLTTGLARGTPQFFRIHGIEPTSGPVPMDKVRALRHPEDQQRVLAGFRTALESGTDAYEIEYRIIRPDGQVRWIFGRGRVVRDERGKPVRYSGVDLDITDRKAAEAALAAAKEALERMNQALEQRVRERTAQLEVEAARRADAEKRLHQAQKMEAVGQLTGGIAHDFNNILQVITGNLEIAKLALERESLPGAIGDPRKVVSDALDTAQRASRSAKQLVQRLMAFSRLQTLEPEVLDANALIEGMEDMVARTLGETIVVRTSLAPRLWLTLADRNQLEAALLNLVVNARDAMPDGGRLVIETANTVLEEGYPEDMAPGGYVTISVSDTGCGIAPEHLPKVFEPFFTTKDTGKGSGLGLSMVYGFVKQSGGHVRIYSEAGSGTTVKIHLPRTDAIEASPLRNATETTTGSSSLPRAHPGETVLLVEDNAEVRRFGLAALHALGYRVLEATDAHNALALFAHDPQVCVDLVFTDVVLPGGMSGRDLAERLRTQRPQVPVLFTSGYTRNAIAHQHSEAADARVLNKPYSIETLARSVRNAIDREVHRS